MRSTYSVILAAARPAVWPTGSALTPDNASDSLTGAGNYRVIGNESCVN